tara:strand:- start:273 stop:515 length:243 start_codon:yes stop_codon:yes gene_type:complete
MVSKEPNFDVMSPKERRQWEAENKQKIPVPEMVASQPPAMSVMTTRGVGKTNNSDEVKDAPVKKKAATKAATKAKKKSKD